ncbi:MAG: DUF5615 family PIN-like protein [Archaeoglobaceae archaeon]|nr:DUF5615 family PIN-like protein [Archaeoglobaceae archaeon]HDD36257.1 hypothetical protein [Archaeoglobus veneficus]
MKFIADENIPLKVVEKLRRENINIESITSMSPRLKDVEIARISERESSYNHPSIRTRGNSFQEIIKAFWSSSLNFPNGF